MASNKKQTYEINNYTRIVLVAMAGLFALAFLTDGMGQLGIIIDNSIGLLLGTGKYVLPIVMVTVAVVSYIDSIEKSDITLSIVGVIMVLIMACYFDSRSLRPGVYYNRFFYGVSNKLLGINGGLLGAFINSFIIHLIGPIGLNISLLISGVVSIVLMFDMDYTNIIKETIKGTSNVAKGIGTGSTKLFKNAQTLGTKVSEKTSEIKEKRELQKLEKQKSKPEPKSEDILINPKDTILSSQDVFGDEKEDTVVQQPVDEDLDTSPIIEQDEKLVETRESRLKESEKREVTEEIEKSQQKVIQYKNPPLNLLKKNKNKNQIDKSEIRKKAKAIEETMANFDIEAHVSQVNTGPTITSYELIPEPGVKLSKIVNLSDNLAFSLASSGIRIEAPIPGKSAVGIEVPNDIKSMVTLEEVINSREFKNFDGDLPLVLGKDVTGEVIVSDIESMPHLLIAGATGSGKSVAINSIILSLVYKSSPADVRLILIDPKIVELGGYNDLPHLLIPVVTDPRKAASTLAWAVDEMERRYKKFSENYVRDITGYNEKFGDTDQKMAKIVIIIDELSDLMMVSSTEVEDYISRLAQMARAAGMHLILATQRPSVDVITGTIKANIPSRISFAVSSGVDSRTILDAQGAEKLLGQGDMLFHPSSYSKPKRIQGSFVSQAEVESVVGFFKDKDYGVGSGEEILEEIESVKEEIQLKEDSDPLFMEALKLAVYEEQASISYLQRRLRIGYSRAARIVDQMEDRNMVGPSNGPKPRDIYITEEEYLQLLGDD